MKLSKLFKGTTAMACALGLGFVSTVNAIQLVVDDVYYLGSIVDGLPPGGGDPSNEFNWLNELILVGVGLSAPSANPAGETLTRSGNNFGALSPALTEDKTDPALGTYLVGGDSLYLLGKYGQAFPGGQAMHVWYLGTLPVGTEVTLPGHALSHDTIFTGARRVPDGGTTVMLLGAGMAFLGFARRLIKV